MLMYDHSFIILYLKETAVEISQTDEMIHTPKKIASTHFQRQQAS